MYSIPVKTTNNILAPVISILKTPYFINEGFLKKMGFEKNEVLSGNEEIVYKYNNPASFTGNGLELRYLKPYSIVSIEEFWFNEQRNGQYLSRNIVGEFSLSSDADLEFIFFKNVRLHFIFNVSNKRI